MVYSLHVLNTNQLQTFSRPIIFTIRSNIVSNPPFTKNVEWSRHSNAVASVEDVKDLISSDQPSLVSRGLIGLARQVLFSRGWCHTILSWLPSDNVSPLQAVFPQPISACLFYCVQKHKLAAKCLSLPSFRSSLDLERYMEILWQSCIFPTPIYIWL